MAADELETMKAIADVLTKLGDDETRVRVLGWAVAKFAKGEVELQGSGRDDSGAKTPKRPKRKKKSAAKALKRSSKPSLSLIRDLNLRPKTGRSFANFAAEKSPSFNMEKCVAAVYYVDRILKKGPVSVDHVYTCFKAIPWRVPANLANSMAWIASHKGWLDTSDMSDIKVTPHGENLIEHDLPKKGKPK